MASQTIQTKRAIEALIRAGLKRSEFSVKCPCVNYEYQDLRISLKLPIKKAVKYINSMILQGFRVWVSEDTEKDAILAILVESYNEWSNDFPQFAKAGECIVMIGELRKTMPTYPQQLIIQFLEGSN